MNGQEHKTPLIKQGLLGEVKIMLKVFDNDGSDVSREVNVSPCVGEMGEVVEKQTQI